jgi:hypothetical protein
MWVGDTTLVQSLWRIVTTPVAVQVQVLAPQDPAGLERRALPRC